ncbi:uncharacterized protein [Ptychodera flava]|uniref:uncharacterized protein n=1 Tax=Ptychodera flava TaxID=63121 RepID=UPI00396A2064
MVAMKLRQKYLVAFLLLLNVVAFIYLVIQNTHLHENRAVRRYTEMIFSLAQIPKGASKYHDASQIDQTGKHVPLTWRLVEDSDVVSPLYRKLFQIRDHLLGYIKDYLDYENLEYGVDASILKYKSFANEGNIQKLEALLREVLYTGRKINIGVVGSSMSMAKSCSTENIFGKCMYAETVARWLHLMTEAQVELHNVALDSANSEYYAWCLQPHLDVSNMDIILVEFAGVDYDIQDVYVRNSYVDTGRPLEDLTRQILSSANAPFPIYINFPSIREIRNKNCINSEYYSQKLLAKHYFVTSVSWNVPFCPKLWHPKFLMSDVVDYDGQNPTAHVHKQIALLLVNTFRKLILQMTEKEIQNAQSSTAYVKQMINDYYRYHGISTDDENPTSHDKSNEFSHGNVNKRTSYDAANNVDLSKKLLAPRFKDTWLSGAQCWPASQPQQIKNHSLQVYGTTPWRYTEYDSRAWWESDGKNEQITFSFTIQNKDNQTAVVAITKISCVTCGQAIVWLDNNFSSSTLIQAKYPSAIFMVDEVAWKVAPGKHTINIKNMEDKLFQVTAIMVGYKRTPFTKTGGR